MRLVATSADTGQGDHSSKMGGTVAKMAFLPPDPTYSDEGLKWLRTTRNHLIPCVHIKHSEAQYTIIYSHGNAEDLGLIVGHLQDLSALLKVNVCGFDYTGYGLTMGKGGVPSEKNAYADVAAAFKYVHEECKVPKNRIIIFGRSLGSGPSTDIAMKMTPRALILQSPLTSAVRVVMNPRMTLPFDIFPNIDKIHKVKCPVFIIHGTEDEVVPFAHGEALYAKARTAVEPFWVSGAGHNNIELDFTQAFFRRLKEFLVALQKEDGL